METTDKQVGWHKALINRNIEKKLEKLGARVQTRKNTKEWFLRIEIQSTIDELNQYLEGNVTPLGLRMALNELINKL
jgi:hypothetical protein